MVTKWLYPEVAAHYHTSWKSVERNIRTVINLCWDRDGGHQLARAVGFPPGCKPSPTRLIQLLAHHFLDQPEEFWSQRPLAPQLSLWPEDF